MRSVVVVLALMISAAGCVPYAVGTTAAVPANGEVVPTGTVTYVPLSDSIAYGGSGAALAYADAAVRVGVGGNNEVGVRFPGLAGFVVSLKHQMVGGSLSPVGVALQGGIGIINGGNNGHAEATLIVSGRESGQIVPYGGLRAMHTVPLVTELQQDAPTLGGFLGIRIGRPDFGVSPEIGVFYDPSVTGIRDSDVVIVPSITVHGSDLLRILAGVPFF